LVTAVVWVGSDSAARTDGSPVKQQIFESIDKLCQWLQKNDYRGYDTFDGLSAVVRPLTFETKFLRTVLQQGVRRFPINLRPLLGIPKRRSTKGMGFVARGCIRLHGATGGPAWGDQAEDALQWLIENQSPGYSGSCWGNHFDFQSRSFFLAKGVPTIVWTSLFGHAVLDGFDHFKKDRYLEIAISACEHILRDLKNYPDGDGTCISYAVFCLKKKNNENTQAVSLLARTYAHTKKEAYLAIPHKAMQYTVQYQSAVAS